MAGLATLPCIVDDRPISAGELLAMQMVENCLREDLKPVEQAKAFRALMNLNGWSGNQLAKELGIAQSGVAQTLKLLDLPDMVQAAVDTGELPASTAYEISKVADPVERTELAERIVSERLTRAETAEAVKAVKAATEHAGEKGRGAGKAKAKKVTERVFKAAGGKVTLENRRGLDDELTRAMLAEALDQVEARLRSRSQDAA